jgi:hypothetical protein
VDVKAVFHRDVSPMLPTLLELGNVSFHPLFTLILGDFIGDVMYTNEMLSILWDTLGISLLECILIETHKK